MAKTLLLADDSVTIQKVVGIAFASEDVDLVTVDNGDDAVTKAKEVRPDVVLADVVMPGMNGYEVCEALKADSALQHVPVLLLTGTFEAFDEDRAQRAGAAGHVAKPFEAQVLVEQVKELLARPPAPSPAPPVPEFPAGETTAAAQAPATPAPGTTGGESFDFFDDELGDLSPPAAGAAPAPSDPAGLDSGFAFGDDDLGGVSQDPLAVSAPVPPGMGSGPPDSTVAIMPQDSGSAVVPPATTKLDPSLGLSDSQDSFLTPAPDPRDVPAPPSADAFDFEIADSDPGRDSGLVSADDLAAATVLDPKGASGFDVSYSDLNAATPPLPEVAPVDPAPASPIPLVAEPPMPAPPVAEPVQSPPQPPAAPVLDGLPPVLEPPPLVEPAQAAAPSPADFLAAQPPSPPAAPEPASEPPRPFAAEAAMPPAPAPLEVGAPFDADFPASEPTSEPTPPEPPVPAPLPEEDPLFGMSDADAEEHAAESSFGDPFAPAETRAAGAPRAGSHDPSALAGMALAEVEPKLREQIHDTLEKVAWESFGSVTEQIVSKAVERVEQIAWEVIPHMAETLIREEIRRMKGEDD